MWKNRIVTLLALIPFLAAVQTLPAHADMLSSGDYYAAAERQQNLTTIGTQLQRDEVRQQLVKLGIDPADAEARIARLPDHEIAQMAEDFESLPAGGDVLGVLGIVFVVLLVLELTGVIDIFKSV